jgi:energy-coupling factor transport system ATP-binding protein
VVDEPTAGLDPLAAMEMMDLFKSIYEEGTSIILVTHDMNVVAKYANKVVVLDNSKIDQVTSPSELFKGDIEKYSLETPALYQTAKDLNKKGYHISLDSLVDVKSLAHEIALEKGKHE